MRQASSSTFAKLLLCAAPLVQAALDSEDKRQNPAVLCETEAKWHTARLDESIGRCRCRGSATTSVISGGTSSRLHLFLSTSHAFLCPHAQPGLRGRVFHNSWPWCHLAVMTLRGTEQQE